MKNQAAMQKLLASGWKQGDPIPEWFVTQDASASVGAKEGSPENPMELSTMHIAGTAPEGSAPQAGAAPQAGQGSIYDNMSDEDIAKFGGMGDLKRQQAQAQEMRKTKTAEGQYVNQGRTFVAASPLEHLVVGAKRFKGARDSKKIGGKQTEGRVSIIDLLRNKGKKQNLETIIDGSIGGAAGLFEEDETGYA